MSRTITQPKPIIPDRNGNQTDALPATTSPAPLWLCDVTKQPVTAEDCLTCSRHHRPNACAFTPPVLQALRSAMRSDPALRAIYALARQQNVTVLRVSSLTGCTRQAWYRLSQGTPVNSRT